MCWSLAIIFLLAAFFLIVKEASKLIWLSFFTLSLITFTYFSHQWLFVALLWILFTLVIAFICYYPVRKPFISKFFQVLLQKMPRISETEEQVLRSGEVSWEGQLLTGRPKWKELYALPPPKLSEEERAFLDGPVRKLCEMIDDWEITFHHKDMNTATWEFIKREGFFGLIIPKAFGGKEFSAWAHAQVLLRIYTRSPTVGTTVAVPNSLGPAELLLKYGTEQQKNEYLPKLAKGEHIPCFALTGPYAGSDAASIPDTGVVCRGIYENKEVLGIRLNWQKRYITLAPVATIIGLAFKLFDPEHLLSSKEERGITLALLPRNLPGIKVGNRHYPMHTPFQNGPIEGHDVFIPMDFIIGGPSYIGQGWLMLMECLGVGRAISIPASGVAGSQVALLSASSYAKIREQFNRSIGDFEGIQIPLARIAMHTYIVDSVHRLVISAVDQGVKPSIASAIVKYQCTERARLIANDAMDIHGGKALCVGPNNYLATLYSSLPISITVEGANILTRNLMVFGQGLIRCHPYLLRVIESLQRHQIDAFDKVILSYVQFVISNKVRTFTRSIFLKVILRWFKPNVWIYTKTIERLSSALALLSDAALFIYGGRLKIKENLSARLGDILSNLYCASALLYRFKIEGCLKEDQELLEYALNDLFYNTETTIIDLLAQLPWFFRFGLRLSIFPLGRCVKVTKDNLKFNIAKYMQNPSKLRDKLTLYPLKDPLPNNPLGEMEALFSALHQHKELWARMHKEVLHDTIEKYQLNEAQLKKSFNHQEVEIIMDLLLKLKKVIAVDDFSPSSLCS